MDGLNSCIPTDCFIYATGDVSCMNPCDHSIFCEVSDFANWPYDFHQCHFEYVSQTKSSNQMQFIDHSVVVGSDGGRESNGYLLISANSTIGERRYVFDGYNSSHSFIVFEFKIQRLPHGYILQIMIPAVVVMVINIVLLLLSPESSERFVLYVVNLFSHCIFLEQLRWM